MTWKIAYKKSNKQVSHIYANYNKGLWVQRGAKQLSSIDNFSNEMYPVHVQGTMGNAIETKWFKEKKEADKYLKHYMRTH